MLLGSDGVPAPTVFAEMSALAAATGAVNLGQGFPDEDGPREVLDAAVDAIRSGANQYPPGRGVPELRAAIAYRGLGGEIFYWSTPGSKEIDFIWVKGARRVGIEVKSSRTWRAEYAKTLNEFLDAGRLTSGFVVYRGRARYRSGRVDGVPVEEFTSLLYTDALFEER